MSLADDVLVMVVLGDYIAIDASGKLNILGGGFNVTSMQVTGTTGPMYIAAIVDVPSKHLGHEFVISLELRDHDTHTAVMLPTPRRQPRSGPSPANHKGRQAEHPGRLPPTRDIRSVPDAGRVRERHPTIARSHLRLASGS